MNYRKSSTDKPTIIDNFNFRSKTSDNPMSEVKQDIISKIQSTEGVTKAKSFNINGVDFYHNELVVHKQAELLQDAFSVKGDYFYLKKGQIVNVRYSIGEYVQIKFQRKVGYFPANVLRLIGGQRWKSQKDKKSSPYSNFY